CHGQAKSARVLPRLILASKNVFTALHWQTSLASVTRQPAKNEMTLRNLIWKELRERPSAVMTSLLAISLGVAALVAIRTVTVLSENAVAQRPETLGANVLLLPKEASLQDYYSADLHGKTIPEEHATRLAMANLEGVESVSPKLCIPAELNGRKLTLTG